MGGGGQRLGRRFRRLDFTGPHTATRVHREGVACTRYGWGGSPTPRPRTDRGWTPHAAVAGARACAVVWATSPHGETPVTPLQFGRRRRLLSTARAAVDGASSRPLCVFCRGPSPSVPSSHFAKSSHRRPFHLSAGESLLLSSCCPPRRAGADSGSARMDPHRSSRHRAGGQDYQRGLQHAKIAARADRASRRSHNQREERALLRMAFDGTQDVHCSFPT